MLRLALVLLAMLAAAPAARAGTFKPPPGKVYTGVSGGVSTQPYSGEVGKDIAVMGVFVQWDGGFDYAFRAADAAGARLMLHISTQDGYGTPRAGHAARDRPRRGRRLPAPPQPPHRARTAKPIYIRFLAEMNQTNNGYSAFDRNGRSRGAAHSTKAFTRRLAARDADPARRPGAAIDAKLRALHLPPDPARRRRPAAAAGRDGVGAADRGLAGDRGQLGARVLAGRPLRRLGRHRLLLALPGLREARALLRSDFKGKPFVFAEWALWGADDPASCIASSAGSLTPARADAALQPGRGARRPVPAQAVPALAQGDPGRAAQAAPSREA